MAGNLSYNQQIDVRYNGGMPRTLRNETMATLADYHRVASPLIFNISIGFCFRSQVLSGMRECG